MDDLDNFLWKISELRKEGFDISQIRPYLDAVEEIRSRPVELSALINSELGVGARYSASPERLVGLCHFIDQVGEKAYAPFDLPPDDSELGKKIADFAYFQDEQQDGLLYFSFTNWVHSAFLSDKDNNYEGIPHFTNEEFLNKITGYFKSANDRHKVNDIILSGEVILELVRHYNDAVRITGIKTDQNILEGVSHDFSVENFARLESDRMDFARCSFLSYENMMEKMIEDGSIEDPGAGKQLIIAYAQQRGAKSYGEVIAKLLRDSVNRRMFSTTEAGKFMAGRDEDPIIQAEKVENYLLPIAEREEKFLTKYLER